MITRIVVTIAHTDDMSVDYAISLIDDAIWNAVDDNELLGVAELDVRHDLTESD